MSFPPSMDELLIGACLSSKVPQAVGSEPAARRFLADAQPFFSGVTKPKPSVYTISTGIHGGPSWLQDTRTSPTEASNQPVIKTPEPVNKPSWLTETKNEVKSIKTSMSKPDDVTSGFGDVSWLSESQPSLTHAATTYDRASPELELNPSWLSEAKGSLTYSPISSLRPDSPKGSTKPSWLAKKEDDGIRAIDKYEDAGEPCGSSWMDKYISAPVTYSPGDRIIGNTLRDDDDFDIPAYVPTVVEKAAVNSESVKMKSSTPKDMSWLMELTERSDTHIKQNAVSPQADLWSSSLPSKSIAIEKKFFTPSHTACKHSKATTTPDAEIHLSEYLPSALNPNQSVDIHVDKTASSNDLSTASSDLACKPKKIESWILEALSDSEENIQQKMEQYQDSFKTKLHMDDVANIAIETSKQAALINDRVDTACSRGDSSLISAQMQHALSPAPINDDHAMKNLQSTERGLGVVTAVQMSPSNDLSSESSDDANKPMKIESWILEALSDTNENIQQKMEEYQDSFKSKLQIDDAVRVSSETSKHDAGINERAETASSRGDKSYVYARMQQALSPDAFDDCDDIGMNGYVLAKSMGIPTPKYENEKKHAILTSADIHLPTNTCNTPSSASDTEYLEEINSDLQLRLHENIKTAVEYDNENRSLGLEGETSTGQHERVYVPSHKQENVSNEVFSSQQDTMLEGNVIITNQQKPDGPTTFGIHEKVKVDAFRCSPRERRRQLKAQEHSNHQPSRLDLESKGDVSTTKDNPSPRTKWQPMNSLDCGDNSKPKPENESPKTAVRVPINVGDLSPRERRRQVQAKGYEQQHPSKVMKLNGLTSGQNMASEDKLSPRARRRNEIAEVSHTNNVYQNITLQQVEKRRGTPSGVGDLKTKDTIVSQTVSVQPLATCGTTGNNKFQNVVNPEKATFNSKQMPKNQKQSAKISKDVGDSCSTIQMGSTNYRHKADTQVQRSQSSSRQRRTEMKGTEDNLARKTSIANIALVQVERGDTHRDVLPPKIAWGDPNEVMQNKENAAMCSSSSSSTLTDTDELYNHHHDKCNNKNKMKDTKDQKLCKNGGAESNAAVTKQQFAVQRYGREQTAAQKPAIRNTNSESMVNSDKQGNANALSRARRRELQSSNKPIRCAKTVSAVVLQQQTASINGTRDAKDDPARRNSQTIVKSCMYGSDTSSKSSSSDGSVASDSSCLTSLSCKAGNSSNESEDSKKKYGVTKTERKKVRFNIQRTEKKVDKLSKDKTKQNKDLTKKDNRSNKPKQAERSKKVSKLDSVACTKIDMNGSKKTTQERQNNNSLVISAMKNVTKKEDGKKGRSFILKRKTSVSKKSTDCKQSKVDDLSAVAAVSKKKSRVGNTEIDPAAQSEDVRIVNDFVQLIIRQMKKQPSFYEEIVNISMACFDHRVGSESVHVKPQETDKTTPLASKESQEDKKGEMAKATVKHDAPSDIQNERNDTQNRNGADEPKNQTEKGIIKSIRRFFTKSVDKETKSAPVPRSRKKSEAKSTQTQRTEYDENMSEINIKKAQKRKELIDKFKALMKDRGSEVSRLSYSLNDEIVEKIIKMINEQVNYDKSKVPLASDVARMYLDTDISDDDMSSESSLPSYRSDSSQKNMVSAKETSTDKKPKKTVRHRSVQNMPSDDSDSESDNECPKKRKRKKKLKKVLKDTSREKSNTCEGMTWFRRLFCGKKKAKYIDRYYDYYFNIDSSCEDFFFGTDPFYEKGEEDIKTTTCCFKRAIICCR